MPRDLPALLDQRLWFPNLRTIGESGMRDGLVAIGGDLSVPRLLLAYRSGIFPWSADPITWWSPDPRAVLELDGFHISRSLERTLRKNKFRMTINAAFESVIAACSKPAPGRESTWISLEMIHAYVRLHQAGIAHSIECWMDGELAGGVYGVAVGGAFCGESMFHRASDASKVALEFVVRHLKERGFVLFDIQMITPVTRQLGATLISRNVYLSRLREAVELPSRFP
ncbi:MAG: leucyl/phenylalanyl-tRNA--protein transferase [Verrucomicrobia bacterium]|nr:leucyl/phenylalanyl-tRNA--protein transferase [Verrucomicrobiota bacterium]